jgi:hypothetical protein
VVGVGPGYFDPIRVLSSSASGTNNFELEKSGFKRVRRDIEVGPGGLMTAKMPDKGSVGTVAFGISWWQGSSQVGRAAFGPFDP